MRVISSKTLSRGSRILLESKQGFFYVYWGNEGDWKNADYDRKAIQFYELDGKISMGVGKRKFCTIIVYNCSDQRQFIDLT